MYARIPGIKGRKSAVSLKFPKQMKSIVFIIFILKKQDVRTFRKTAACLSAKLKRV